jgi:hypothetical protein
LARRHGPIGINGPAAPRGPLTPGLIGTRGGRSHNTNTSRPAKPPAKLEPRCYGLTARDPGPQPVRPPGSDRGQLRRGHRNRKEAAASGGVGGAGRAGDERPPTKPRRRFCASQGVPAARPRAVFRKWQAQLPRRPSRAGTRCARGQERGGPGTWDQCGRAPAPPGRRRRRSVDAVSRSESGYPEGTAGMAETIRTNVRAAPSAGVGRGRRSRRDHGRQVGDGITQLARGCPPPLPERLRCSRLTPRWALTSACRPPPRRGSAGDPPGRGSRRRALARTEGRPWAAPGSRQRSGGYATRTEASCLASIEAAD